MDAFAKTFCNNRGKRMSLFLKFCVVTRFDHTVTCASILLQTYLIVFARLLVQTCGDSTGSSLAITPSFLATYQPAQPHAERVGSPALVHGS